MRIKKELTIANGETLAYMEQGNGQDVCNFMYMDIRHLGYTLIHLFERLPEGFKAYAVDLRGSGDSTYNNEINSLGDFSDDLHSFISSLSL